MRNKSAVKQALALQTKNNNLLFELVQQGSQTLQVKEKAYSNNDLMLSQRQIIDQNNQIIDQNKKILELFNNSTKENQSNQLAILRLLQIPN